MKCSGANFRDYVSERIKYAKGFPSTFLLILLTRPFNLRFSSILHSIYPSFHPNLFNPYENISFRKDMAEK